MKSTRSRRDGAESRPDGISFRVDRCGRWCFRRLCHRRTNCGVVLDQATLLRLPEKVSTDRGGQPGDRETWRSSRAGSVVVTGKGTSAPPT